MTISLADRISDIATGMTDAQRLALATRWVLSVDDPHCALQLKTLSDAALLVRDEFEAARLLEGVR